jgi:nicotinamide mononucleotide transporter
VTPLEMAANLVMTASILLAARNSVHTWWTGIIGCLLFGMLFFEARLYADATLQVFFIATSAWGWRLWLGRGTGAERPVTRARPRVLLACIVAALAATAGYGTLLHALTDAWAPFVDSAVLAFSVVAQLLLTQRRLETWAFWLLVNTLAVPLFASRGLHLTAALYTAYWVNALVAWRHWRRLAGTPA